MDRTSKPRRAAPAERSDQPYRPKARSRLVPGARESFRRAVWLFSGRPRNGARGVRARIAVRPSVAAARRCTIKGRFVRKRTEADFAKSSELHLSYVEREGVERDGSRGVLYSADAARTATECRARILRPESAEQHQFRFIVAPEDAGELDLTKYVRELMRRVEIDLGQPIEWSAVNHYNTDHPHAHVIIRGVDRNGQALRIDPEYIKHNFRQRAQTLSTEWLGPRTERDLQRQSEREIEQMRWTQLDRRIERKARERGGVVDSVRLDTYERQRMRVLEQLGLAQRASSKWQLSDGWRERLREMGERGDVIKQMHKAMPGLDSSRFVVMEDSLPSVATEGERIHGRVAELGLRDDELDGMYALIETTRGTGYYIPLRSSQLNGLRQGDLVTMRAWTDRRGLRRASFERQRLTMDAQVSYPGPTWLDSVKPSGASEFARNVASRQRARDAFLRSRKLERSALRHTERHAVARYYAKKRQTHVCSRLGGFSGRVVAVHEAQSGTRFWIVEHAEKGIVAIRADVRGGDLVGKDVRLGFVERGGRLRLEVAVAVDQGRER